ncbi:MAG: hypothetical protein J3R72DRAFT_420956 [Linnemannia gamsii]|nr:MAG: hypothetical protein J3R72DRAFT_420956 [Linnemannia gamsii]
MNLSQILNPPGSSSSPSSSTATVPLAPPNINNNNNSNTTHRLGQGHGFGQGHGHGHGRTSSSPTPQPPYSNNSTSRSSSTATSPTAVLSPVPIASAQGGLRWATDNPSNGSPQQTPTTTTLAPAGSSSRKHANSVSVAQLEESASTFSHPSSANTPPQRKSNSSSTAVGHNVSTQKSKSHNSSGNSNSNNEINNSNNHSNGFSHSGSLTFRAYDPQNQFKDVAFASSPNPSASSATAEAAYQDSFQGMVTDPSDAKPGPRKTTTKKTTGSSPPRAIEGDTQQQPQQQQQQQRDFKFVVEGQDKAKATKPVAFEVLPPFQVKSPAHAQSPSQDTPGEESLDQDAPESSPTPDFERNADGKYVPYGDAV